jgi:hypothetical protein
MFDLIYLGSKVEPLTSGGPSSGVISHSCSYSLFVARIGELDISPRFSSLRELLLRASVLLADGDGMIIQSLLHMC